MARISFSGVAQQWPHRPRRSSARVSRWKKRPRLAVDRRCTTGEQLAADEPHGILLGAGVAKALKLQTGDPVTLLVNTAEGALNSMELMVAGSFQSFSSDFDARAVRVPLAGSPLRSCLGARGVNTVVVSLQRTEDTGQVVARLRERLAASDLEVMTWMELNELYEGAVALYERQFGVLRLIILVLVLSVSRIALT